MPRSIEEIQADIAKVKQEIALRDRYTQGFNQPRTSVGWGSYIVDGDRGLLDAYQGRESDWKKMMEQQEFQAAERALAQKFTEAENQKNRDLQERIANLNKNDKGKEVNQSKVQLDADLAQAEYDDAMAKLDLDNSATVLAAKKAALRLNYANSQLPYFDKSVHIVPTEFKEDAPGVAKTKKINYAKSVLDPIIGLPAKNWTDEQRAQYNEQKKVIDELAPELSKNYEVELTKKGGTVEDNELNEFNKLDKKLKAGENMTARQKKRHAELKKKLGK